MIKVRAVFEKKGRAKYISHLDLNRCMQRAFKRSGIPVWYTEGFNPHIYITFALPLSLGYESSVEIMDFNLTQEQPPEETVSRLNSAMPEGLRILKVYTPETKHTEIKQACYKILLSGANADIEKAFGDFMAQDRIITMKRTKRGGEKEIDLKPDIEVKEVVSVKDGTEIVLCLPAGNEKNINPSLVLESFEQFSGISFETERVERTGIFSENGKEFY